MCGVSKRYRRALILRNIQQGKGKMVLKEVTSDENEKGCVEVSQLIQLIKFCAVKTLQLFNSANWHLSHTGFLYLFNEMLLIIIFHMHSFKSYSCMRCCIVDL